MPRDKLRSSIGVIFFIILACLAARVYCTNRNRLHSRAPRLRLKGTTSYTPAPTATGATTKNAIAVAETAAVNIPNSQQYTFTGGGSSCTIKSENEFKNDPSIAGFVLGTNGNPIKDATIKISGDGKTQTLTTDLAVSKFS